MKALKAGQHALVSIHDVMPETLAAVQRCLDECRARDVYDVYLLVVPGRSWSCVQIQQLHQWVEEGCLLAGHGWLHECSRIVRPYHRLHSALMSRNVAEHLELEPGGITALMMQCHDWFVFNQLPAPSLYVPPAWALGKVENLQIQRTGFEFVETLRGVVHLQRDQRKLSLLLGYEADTALRRRVLSVWNRANRRLAHWQGAIRIGLHPDDLDLQLSRQLRADLARCQAITLHDIFGKATVKPAEQSRVSS